MEKDVNNSITNACKAGECEARKRVKLTVTGLVEEDSLDESVEEVIGLGILTAEVGLDPPWVPEGVPSNLR